MKHNGETGDLFDFTDLDEKLTEAHCNRAFGYLRLGELELATKAAQTVLKINQDYPPALSILDLIRQEYFIRGLTSIKENKVSAGIRAFLSVVAIDPTFADAYYELARLYLKLDELEEAEKATKKVLRLDSGSEPAHELLDAIKRAYCTRGHADLRLDRLTGAKASVDKALKLDSNYEPARGLWEKIKWAYHAQGITFSRQNQYDKAIASFESVLAMDNYFLEAHCEIVRTYLRQGVLESAENAIRKVLRLDAGYGPAYTLLAEIKDAYYNFTIEYLRQGKFVDAEKMVKELSRLELSGELLLKIKNVYCDQGQAYLSQGKLKFAKKTVEEVLRLDANYDAAHQLLAKIKYAYCNRGTSLLKRSQYEEAISSFKKALVIDPGFTKAHCGLVHAYLGQRELAFAEKSVNKIVELDPNCGLVLELLKEIKHGHYNLGIEYLAQGRFTDAEKSIREVLRLDSSDESLLKIKDMYCHHGQIYLSQGKYDFAVKAVREVLRLDSGYEPAHVLLGEVKHAYYEIGCTYLTRVNLTDAKKVIDKILRLDPGYESAPDLLRKIKHTHQARGTVFLQEGRNQEANADFQRAAAIDLDFTERDYVEAYCRLGDFYLHRSELNSAHFAITQALRLDSEYELASDLLKMLKYAYYNRMINFLNENQYDLAIDFFESLLSMDPHFLKTRWRDALTFLAQGDLEATKRIVSEILKCDCDSDYGFESEDGFASAVLENLKHSYYNRGLAFLEEDQYNEAVSNFEYAIDIDENFTEAYSGLQDACLGFESIGLEQLDIVQEGVEEADLIAQFKKMGEVI